MLVKMDDFYSGNLLQVNGGKIMNSRERFLAALTGKPLDMLPVDIHFADDVAQQCFCQRYGMEPEEFYTWLGNDVRHTYVMDEIELFLQNKELMNFAFAHGYAFPNPRDSGLCFDQWGIGWSMVSDGQLPVSSPLDDWDGLEKIKAPAPDSHYQFYMFDKCIEEYQRKELAVDVAQYFGPFEKSYLIRGFEDFLVDMYFEQEKVEELLDIITDYRVKMAHQIVARGVTYGHSGDDFGTQSGPIMSLDIWQKLFRPRLERIWKVYRDAGLPIVHHSCGDCQQFLDDMLDIGLSAIHPVQATAMDIHELSSRYGDRLVFYGGFDTSDTLTNGTPEAVRANVKETIETLGKYGRMICAPINIMRNVPQENFAALIEAIGEYRRVDN